MAEFSCSVRSMVGDLQWGHEMEKGLNSLQMVCQIFWQLSWKMYISFLLLSPQSIPLFPDTFITFLLLRSSKSHLWMCHSKQFCLSVIFSLINATKFWRQLWLLLTRVSSAILIQSQVCVSAYHSSWFQQLVLPGDCQGRCAISLLKITH